MAGNRTQPAPPRKPRNRSRRKREYLEAPQVAALMKAANQLGRNGHRDSTMILVAFRHGLRAKELTSMLDWHQVDLVGKTLAVQRCKGSKDTEHTLEKDEVAALKKLGPQASGPVFANERGGRVSENSFHKIVQRAGIKAGLGAHIHPHMLRHSCGFDMTSRGIPTRYIQEWLGHRNIQHTVRYTELGPGRFKKIKMW
jgi:type 1 fimbriae regulatory protein FimB/type 1 fimbriae regulatory protein FimE